MNKYWCLTLVFLLLSGLADLRRSVIATPSHPPGQDSVNVGLISADELKAKLSSNTPVTIIDVRATNGYAESTARIKGAIHVKLRKLKSRLAFPPLKNVSRDSEVVTYCACPTEEASIQAARILLDGGFKNVRALKGGWQEWLKIKGPVDSKPKGM